MLHKLKPLFAFLLFTAVGFNLCAAPPNVVLIISDDQQRGDVSEAFKDGRLQMVKNLEAWPTLPRLLGQASYHSLQTGKWWLGDYRHGGFTDGMTKGGRHGDKGLEIGRKTLQPIYDFIAQSRKESKPFFVWYAPMMPHEPHTPPERILGKYRDKAPSEAIAKYWAMVEWFDETCGDLLNYLEREGLAEDTLVLYLADNGWLTDPKTGRYAPKSKQSPYDGGLRTPIIVRWKGRLAPKSSDVPVASLDLFPTILKACGVKPPANLPGLDLAQDSALLARTAIYGECYTHDFVALDKATPNLRWRWILQDGWKLILPAPQNEKGGAELYDLKADPQEERNLADTKTSRVANLRSRLDAWWPGREASQ